MIGLFVIWIVTVVISYVTTFLAFKFEVKYSEEITTIAKSLEDIWLLFIFMLFVPIVNILLSIVIFIVIFIDVAMTWGDKKDKKDMFKKIFFIKEKV